MSPVVSEFFAYRTELQELHQQLKMNCRKIKEIIIQENPDLGQFEPLLLQLRSLVLRQAEDGDNGGCLDEAVSRLPALGKEADRLRLEYQQIVVSLDKMLLMLCSDHSTIALAGELGKEFDDNKKRLADLELVELGILEKGFNFYLD
jgi:hypothetical protein